MPVDFAFDITPTKVVSSFCLLKSPIGVVVRSDQRENWGIALKTGGKTYYSQNGKQFLSDSVHVMLLPKGGSYTWTCVEQGECILINFDAPENGDVLRGVEISDGSYIRSAFSKIEKCLSLDNPVSRLEAMQHLYGILFFLAKAATKKYVPRDKRHILTPAVDYMMENYSDPEISNDYLASLCGISTVYFRKTFEAVYGTPPIRYLQDFRLNKAKSILLSDYGSISQVAESVGYNSVYHFSKMFRQHTGQSPSDYAKGGQKR